MAPVPEENGGLQTPAFLINHQIAHPHSAARPGKASVSVPRKLENEVDRLQTFDSWPLNFISKESLAAAGFYYLNKDDRVKCPFCDLEVGCWEEGDDPMKDHKRWSPSCAFVKAFSAAKGNLKISPKNLKRGNDVCGFLENWNILEIRPNSCSERGPNPEQLEITKHRAPVYPQYANIDVRMKTFDEWPISLQPRPKELADAGFWYSGKSDETFCFHCGGGLKDWDPLDDPWVEHSKWYPLCSHVQLNKASIKVDQPSQGELLISSQDIENLCISSDEEQTEQSTSKASSVETKHSENSNPEIDDRRLCKVCFQEELGVVTLPCSHLVTCVKCAPSLTTCPVCRKPFTALVRVHL